MLLLLLFTACSSDDDPTKEIVLDKTTPTSQTIYSDETSAKEGISFTATENWAAVVNDISTRAEGRVDWLELSQYNGGPGTYTLGITIAKNDTGSDRKAEIKIVCGGTTITVIVEQKAVTSDEAGKEPGVDPEKPQAKRKVKTIKMYQEPDEYDKNNGIKDIYLTDQFDLSYDDKGRIVKFGLTETDIIYPTSYETISFNYKKQGNGNLMIEVESKYNDETYSDMEYLYCDHTGKVVSAKEVENDKEIGDINEYQYQYNEQNQLIQTKSMESSASVSYTTDFIWSNSNIATYISTERYLGSGDITYSDLKNDANIDLAYLACFFNSTEQLAFPHGLERGTIAGYFGNRVANMPTKIVETEDGTKYTFIYEYKLNSEGYIDEIFVFYTNTNSSREEVIKRKRKVVIEYMN